MVRDFSEDRQPLEDPIIARKCVVVVALDGKVGRLHHILSSKEPDRANEAVQRLFESNGSKRGISTVLTGGRDCFSEGFISNLVRGLKAAGFDIKDQDILGTYDRKIRLVGSDRLVKVEKTSVDTGKRETKILSFG